MTNPPTADQLDHLIGHTSNRALTPAEHEALRAAVNLMRTRGDAFATAALGDHGNMIRGTMGGYLTQLKQQLTVAEEELALWRRQRAREAELEEQLAEARTWARRGRQMAADPGWWDGVTDMPAWLVEE